MTAEEKSSTLPTQEHAEVPVLSSENGSNDTGSSETSTSQQDSAPKKRKRRRGIIFSEEEVQKRRLIFKKEIEPQLPRLYNFALSLTNNNPDAAQDLLQETCLRAFEALDTYEPGTNVRAWLFTIMRNLHINEYRKRKNLPTHLSYEEHSSYRNEDEDEGKVQAVAGDDLRLRFYTDYYSDPVTQSLQKLPEEFRSVVLLTDQEGLKYEEVAHILNIPIGTVRSRLHRARKLLKEELREYAYEHYRIEERERKSPRSSRQESQKESSSSSEETAQSGSSSPESEADS